MTVKGTRAQQHEYDVVKLGDDVTSQLAHARASAAVSESDFWLASLTLLGSEDPAVAEYRFANSPDVRHDAPWWIKDKIYQAKARAQVLSDWAAAAVTSNKEFIVLGAEGDSGFLVKGFSSLKAQCERRFDQIRAYVPPDLRLEENTPEAYIRSAAARGFAKAKGEKPKVVLIGDAVPKD